MGCLCCHALGVCVCVCVCVVVLGVAIVATVAVAIVVGLSAGVSFYSHCMSYRTMMEYA